MVDDRLRELVLARKSASEIQDAACAQGLKLMREDGWVKVRKGITTVDEIVRVTKVDSVAMAK